MIRSMRAVAIGAYGGNEVLTFEDGPWPQPGPGEVRVAIRAAGVNPIDWKIRSGAGRRMGLTLPIRLGSEISGVVQAIGDGVDGLREGDEVFGIVPSGGFAQFAVARAGDLSRKPGRLDHVQAAAVPLGALTAWQAMFDIANLKAGEQILIAGSSGGVGSLAVQLASARGAHVTAMASARNESFVRDLGVDAFIDYAAAPFDQVVRGMDVVFDTVGGETFERAHAVLRPGGRLVTAVAFPAESPLRPDVRVERIFTKADGAMLAKIGELVDAGRLRPHVSAVLPFAEVARALEISERGRVTGKIVIEIG